MEDILQSSLGGGPSACMRNLVLFRPCNPIIGKGLAKPACYLSVSHGPAICYSHGAFHNYWMLTYYLLLSTSESHSPTTSDNRHIRSSASLIRAPQGCSQRPQATRLTLKRIGWPSDLLPQVDQVGGYDLLFATTSGTMPPHLYHRRE